MRFRGAREPAEDEGADSLVRGVDLGVAPFGRVRRVVEAASRVEGGTRCRPRVISVEGAVGDTLGDDARELVDERLDMCLDDLARIRGELDVGSEELGVVEGFTALRFDEVVEPALEALGCRSLSGRDGFEGLGDLRQPALGDGVAKRGLARKVPVDASVADAEGAGDVDDVRLGGAVAAGTSSAASRMRSAVSVSAAIAGP